MKNIYKISSVFLLVIGSFFSLTSCDDTLEPLKIDELPVVADNTIAGKAIATPDLSILVAALKKTNLVAAVQLDGPITVFAPTNAAFTAAGISLASIEASTMAEVATLKQTLLNHVLAGNIRSEGFVDNSYLRTLGLGASSATKPLSMFIKKTTTAGNTVIKINNNATVAISDILASNGVIHIVDKVITPPTIVDLVAGNTNFSSLVGALTTASLITTLQGAGPFTVFAPNNAAFTALPINVPAAASPTTAQLTNILTYHVVAGNFLAASLPTVVAAGPTTTLNPQTFLIGLTPTPNIKGSYTPVQPVSNIITIDIQGKNGVIHVLDRVLLPATF